MTLGKTLREIQESFDQITKDNEVIKKEIRFSQSQIADFIKTIKELTKTIKKGSK